MKNQGIRSQRFGSRGEYLVIMQGMLFLGFIMTPIWPELRNTELYRTLTIFRWILLTTSWSATVIFGIGGAKGIRRYLTPLPYPVDNNQLVQTGVYGLVRHPLYSSMIFAAAGWSIFSMSLTHLLMTAMILLFFNYKASKEETWLTERHPEYRDYVKKVGKFFPRLSKSDPFGQEK
jgi:protein-S-isoprenylcysteine O-methyltransferase Ste14